MLTLEYSSRNKIQLVQKKKEFPFFGMFKLLF